MIAMTSQATSWTNPAVAVASTTALPAVTLLAARLQLLLHQSLCGLELIESDRVRGVTLGRDIPPLAEINSSSLAGDRLRVKKNYSRGSIASHQLLSDGCTASDIECATAGKSSSLLGCSIDHLALLKGKLTHEKDRPRHGVERYTC